MKKAIVVFILSLIIFCGLTIVVQAAEAPAENMTTAINRMLTEVVFPLLAAFVMALVSIAINWLSKKLKTDVLIKNKQWIDSLVCDAISYVEEESKAMVIRHQPILTSNQKLSTAVIKIMNSVPKITKKEAEDYVHTKLAQVKGPGATGEQAIKSVILILAFTAMLFSAGFAEATDIKPTCKRQYVSRYCTWQLSDAMDSTGDTNIAVNVGFCTCTKTLEFVIVDDGGVDIVAEIKEGVNAASVKTYTFDTAGIYRYPITHTVSDLYATMTITSGTITTNLECSTR